MSENVPGRLSMQELNEMAGWGEKGIVEKLLNPSAFKGTDKLIRGGCLRVFNMAITSGLMGDVDDNYTKRLLLSTLPTPQKSRDLWLLDLIDKPYQIHQLATADRTAFFLKRLLVNPNAKIETIQRRFNRLTDELKSWDSALKKIEGVYPSVNEYLKKFEPIAVVIKEDVYSLLDSKRVGEFAVKSMDELMSMKFETPVAV